MTQKEVSELLNIPQPHYSRWENGQRNPKEENIVSIAKALGVTYEFLTDTEILPVYQKLTSIRKKVVLQVAENELTEQEEESNIIKFNKSLRPYRVVDQALSAGAGFGYTDDVSYSVVFYHKELEYDLATWVSGDSMEPEFFNGEVVLVKKQEEPDYDGQVCAVDWDGNSYIKKVFIDEEGMVLRSINPLYDDKFASWDEHPRLIGVITDHFKPERKK